MRSKHSLCPSWEASFWNFVSDMGERPSPKHQLYRVDKSKGYNKDNCIWKETIANSKETNEYARAWRKQNPDRVRDSEYKKRFGISYDVVKAKLEEQSHLCAICKQPESAQHNGKVRNLALDHCHTTGKIRGMLCTNCNTVLGNAKDNTDVLRSAINYLENYKETL